MNKDITTKQRTRVAAKVPTHRITGDAGEAKGREIIASLTELAETLEKGGPDADLERFTARTVEVAGSAWEV